MQFMTWRVKRNLAIHPPSSAALQSITQGYAMTAEGAGTLFPYQ